MSLDPAAAAVADDALRGLVAALETKDVERLMPLFTENASVFGSEDSEVAIGRDAMRGFFTELLEQPRTIAWRWQVTASGRDGDVVWFVAPGTAVITASDGSTTDVEPYRISGVLRQVDGAWLFELFNGSEPTVPD